MGDAAIVPAKQLELLIDDASRAIATLVPAEPLRDVFVLTGKVQGLHPEAEPVVLVGNGPLLVCVDRGFSRSFLTPARLRMRFEAVGDSYDSAKHPMVAYHKFDGRADHFSHLDLEPSRARDLAKIKDNSMVVVNRSAVETFLWCFKEWHRGIEESPTYGGDTTNRDAMLLGALFYARACRNVDPATRRELARTYLEGAESSDFDPISKMKFIGALMAVAKSEFASDREGFVAFLNKLGAERTDQHLTDIEALFAIWRASIG
jgi:predicted ABC-class ATPase